MKLKSQPIDEHLFVAGVSYRTAPIEVRERLAVAHPDRLEVSRLLQSQESLSEVVLLWTCNRVEIYGVAPTSDGNVQSMFRCLAEQTPELTPHIYCHRGREAVEHLFKVAGGLDSMVFGETQITGQVKEAYESARQSGLTGKLLNRVFQKALQTAKEIRTRTAIGHGANSVGSVAVAHAEEVLQSGLAGKTVLVIGAGKMAANCLRHLRKKGVESVLVANRSIERAQDLVREFNGRAIAFDRYTEALAEADIVVSSTSSPEQVICRKDVEPVLQKRNGRPLVMIDIAVPRDIEPGVGDLEGVHLYDIDALESTVLKTRARREQDMAVCESIIDRKVVALSSRLNVHRIKTCPTQKFPHSTETRPVTQDPAAAPRCPVHHSDVAAEAV